MITERSQWRSGSVQTGYINTGAGGLVPVRVAVYALLFYRARCAKIRSVVVATGWLSHLEYNPTWSVLRQLAYPLTYTVIVSMLVQPKLMQIRLPELEVKPSSSSVDILAVGKSLPGRAYHVFR